jgi:putative redox protein
MVGPVPDAAALSVEPGWVKVIESGEGKLTELLLDGRHQLFADEPTAAGGSDRGPGPYELLLMALGACTTMTLRLYADRKRWPLTRVSVQLRHARIHAEDCADCETKQGMIDRIERVISLEGALDDAQRQRLLEIADMCPVHRTLTSEIKIETRLAAA